MQENIFSYIDSVLFHKRKVNTINENETDFNLYMVNRWCSMYSADVSQIINETTNKYSKVLNSKQEQYDFLFNFLPKYKKKRIDYIKKVKEEKTEENEEIPYMAKAMELSEREVKQYIDFLKELPN